MVKRIVVILVCLLGLAQQATAQTQSCDPPPGGDFGFFSGTWTTTPILKSFTFVSLPYQTNGASTRQYRIQSFRDGAPTLRHNLYINYQPTTQLVAALHDPATALVEAFQLGIQRDPTDTGQGNFYSQNGCWYAVNQSAADLRYNTIVWNATLATPGKPALIALFQSPRLMVVGIGTYLGQAQLPASALAMRCPAARVRVLVDGVARGQTDAVDPAARLMVGDSILVVGQRVEIEWSSVGTCTAQFDLPDGAGTLKVLQ